MTQPRGIIWRISSELEYVDADEDRGGRDGNSPQFSAWTHITGD
jgi:hypothetical protein